MRLGYSQAIITPSLEKTVYLAGFGQNRTAESIHDDLFVRAAAISDGDTTLVLCALDLIGFFQNDVREIIQRVQITAPDVQIIIASTHTHHGPDTQGLWGPDDKTRGVDEDYLLALKEKIAQTIEQSLVLEFKADRLKVGSVHVPGTAKNARDPEIVDDELTVLQFLSPEGKPALTIMDFPCHPEVLWEHNLHITSDYPGQLRKRVEAQTKAPAVFFSGALGGMMTPDVEENSFE